MCSGFFDIFVFVVEGPSGLGEGDHKTLPGTSVCLLLVSNNNKGPQRAGFLGGGYRGPSVSQSLMMLTTSGYKHCLLLSYLSSGGGEWYVVVLLRMIVN